MRLQELYECVIDEIEKNDAVVQKDILYLTYVFRGFSQFASDMIIEAFGGDIIETYDGKTFDRVVEVYPACYADWLILDQFDRRYMYKNYGRD